LIIWDYVVFKAKITTYSLIVVIYFGLILANKIKEKEMKLTKGGALVYLGLTSLPDPISFLSVPPSFLHHLRNPEPSTTRDLAQPSKRGSVTSD